MYRSPNVSPSFNGSGKLVTPTTLAMYAVLAASCVSVETTKEFQEEGQAAPKISTTFGGPQELARGLWSIAIEVDVPTTDQSFVRLAGDNATAQTTSALLTKYQQTFAAELQRALGTLMQRNAHCTVSAMSVLYTRQVWIGGRDGGPMALPSGAIVVLPCGGNEPLVKPEATVPQQPH
ncbi:MAG: hypothetical protein Q7R80_01280 [bacterium]|nr:hypothetical protein [bacterium]